MKKLFGTVGIILLITVLLPMVILFGCIRKWWLWASVISFCLYRFIPMDYWVPPWMRIVCFWLAVVGFPLLAIIEFWLLASEKITHMGPTYRSEVGEIWPL